MGHCRGPIESRVTSFHDFRSKVLSCSWFGPADPCACVSVVRIHSTGGNRLEQLTHGTFNFLNTHYVELPFQCFE